MEEKFNFPTLAILNESVIGCRICTRLVHYRETVPPKNIYKDQLYWRRPVPGFGDPSAQILLTGLAPAAHGGNRTGRVFTGDESGRFLFSCLYAAGLSNQPTAESIDDGLELINCYINASVKCVPPDNKPTYEEFMNCNCYYKNELELLVNLRAVVALGALAFNAFLQYAKTRGIKTSQAKFAHGACYKFEGLPTLYGSYHPSPRNTNTGRLTPSMLIELLNNIKKNIEKE